VCLLGYLGIRDGEAARDGNLVERTLGYYSSDSAIMIDVVP
jgi:hypothetical protein